MKRLATILLTALCVAVAWSQETPKFDYSLSQTYGGRNYQALTWVPVKHRQGGSGRLSWEWQMGPGFANDLADGTPALAGFAREALRYDAKEMVVTLGPTFFAFYSPGSRAGQIRLGLSVSVSFAASG